MQTLKYPSVSPLKNALIDILAKADKPLKMMQIWEIYNQDIHSWIMCDMKSPLQITAALNRLVSMDSYRGNIPKIMKLKGGLFYMEKSNG